MDASKRQWRQSTSFDDATSTVNSNADDAPSTSTKRQKLDEEAPDADAGANESYEKSASADEQTPDPASSQLRSQMEFYFSDANLNRDRFLRDAIAHSSDGWIPASLFLKFNRIVSLTTSEETILESVAESQSFDIDADKRQLRRRTVLKPIESAEDRTVYIERVALDATHESIKALFSSIGSVAYVSIPRNRPKEDGGSSSCKGFAFVEFTTKADAASAVERQNEAGVRVLSKTRWIELRNAHFERKRVVDAQLRRCLPLGAPV